MLNDNGTFMPFKSFKEKFGIKTDYITYIRLHYIILDVCKLSKATYVKQK